MTQADDLGRVVIPKEIRRTMRIREGDPLEIYTDREGEVIFKKYSPIGELTSFASQYAESLHKICELSVVITDRDAVIACAGVPRKDFSERTLSSEMESIMEDRSLYTDRGEGKHVYITQDSGSGYYASCIMPIITAGDLIGSVATLLPEGSNQPRIDINMEIKLVQTAASFLSKQMEN